MPCYQPLVGYRGEGGKLTFKDTGGLNPMEVTCGNCIGCRLDRSKSWAIRCVHEAQLHQENAFITLTYDDDHLPEDRSVNKKHFQRFMKDLRQKYPTTRIRFFHCGEYGEQHHRPHYHALIFGFNWADRRIWSTRRGNDTYTSKELQNLWKKGFATIGDVTWQSAAYTARYIVKKINGEMADDHYLRIDKSTGEAWKVQPEYTTMSRRPGIGSEWLERFWRDVYPRDSVIINGRQYKPPRYYDKWLAENHPDLLEEVLAARQEFADQHHQDNTDQRLATREFVQKDKAQKFLKRAYEDNSYGRDS